MANNDILKAKQIIEEFNLAWKEHAKFIAQATDTITKFTKAAKIPSNYVKALNEISTNHNNMAQSYDKMVTAQKKATVSQKALERERVKELKLATQREKKFDSMTNKLDRESKAAERSAIRQKKLTNAFNQLNKELREAEDRYKHLAASQGLSDKQTISAQKNVQKLRSKIDAINKPIKRFGDNVGNYKSGLSGLKGVVTGLVGAFGVIEGLRLAFDFTKEAVEMAKAAKGVEFAFNRLGESGQNAFSNIKKSTRGLVSNLDIKKALVDFQNFNIDLEQTDTLFEFLAVRSAQTGQSIDKLKDSLVEGLSKESKLRIDNLGISAGDLNAELEKTPDFVTAVANIAKREIKEAGGILDKAANSSERFKVVLSNAQLELGKLFTGESVGVLGFFSDKIEEIGEAFKSIRKGIRRVKIGLDAFMKPIRDLIKRSPFLVKVFKTISEAASKFFDLLNTSGLTVFGKAINHFGAALSGLGAAISQTIKSVKSLFDSFKFLGMVFKDPLKAAEMTLNGGFAKMFKVAISESAKNGKKIGSVFYDAYKKALEPLEDEAFEPNINGNQNSNGDGNGDIKRSLPKTENVEIIDLTKNTESYRQELEYMVSNFKKLRDEQMEGSAEWSKYNTSMEYFEEVLDSGIKVGDDFENMLKNKVESAKNAKATMDALKQATEEYISTFSDGFFADAGLGSLEQFFDGTFDRLLAGADEVGEKFAVTFNAISEVGQEAFNLISQASQQNFEAEYSRLEQQKEVSLQFAGDSTTAKQEIEEQYETRRKQIARRQAEAEKKQALFNIAIDTAQGVVSALASTPPNIPLSIAIGVIGAAQLGVVASRQIPQFWEGGYVGGSQDIMVNDDPYGKKGANYKEVIQKPNGQILKPQGKNVKMNVPKGTFVHKSYDDFDRYLQGELDRNGIAPFHNMQNSAMMNIINNNGIDMRQMDEVVGKHIGRLNKTINNQPKDSFMFDENGFKSFVNKGHSRKEKLNARQRGRGRDV